MKKAKISLIGAGQIGGTIAYTLAQKNYADIILFDVNEGTAKGKALDIMQAIAINGQDTHILGTSNYADIYNSDIIIVTAGVPRKPGMSRDDLVKVNAEVIKTVAQNIATHSPDSFVIVVTNPLDAMVGLMQKESKLPTQKVVGMAGILDSARFKLFLANEFKVSTKDVHAAVLGGHGDTMVPLTRYSTINGVPVPEMIKLGFSSQEKIDAIVQRTRDGGGEIVKFLGNGSAFYAPAISAIEMAESYLQDKKRLFPCASFLTGEYGVNNLFIGVPTIIGKNGVESIIELELNQSELAMFNKSVAAVTELMKII